MARGQKVNVEVEIDEKDLPPIFRKLIGDVRNDRKTLLRDKAYENPAQLRAFVAQYLYPRLIDVVKILGQASYDTYQLAQSTAIESTRFQKYVVRELDLDDDGGSGGVNPDILDDMQEAMYALGSVLQQKMPEDQEVMDAFNAVAGRMADAVGELMGDGGSDRDEDEREDEAPSEESDADKEPDGEEPAKAADDGDDANPPEAQ
jgi:hypothetical protein